MKQFLAIGLLMFSVSVVSGQTNDSGATSKAACTLTMAQAPDVAGIKLGMTVEQVLALFPGSREDNELRADFSKPPNQFGMSSFTLYPDRYAPKSKPTGISRLTFTLLDGRVTTLNAGYDGTEWKHVDLFIEKFSKGKRLPAVDAWEARVGMDNQLKTLKCKDFEISIFAGGKNVHNINYVKLDDPSAQQKMDDREIKAREKEVNKVMRAIPGTALLP